MEFEKIIDNDKKPIYGSLIKNKQFIAYLTKKINYNYMVRGKEISFPAPQPVSIEKKDFRNSRGLSFEAGIRSDQLTSSVRNALEILTQQVDRERVAEETRILSSDEFSNKMDELINAVQTSGRLTIGGKEFSQINKGLVDKNSGVSS